LTDFCARPAAGAASERPYDGNGDGKGKSKSEGKSSGNGFGDFKFQI
jgi:hypothetical protein